MCIVSGASRRFWSLTIKAFFSDDMSPFMCLSIMEKNHTTYFSINRQIDRIEII